MDQAYFPKTSRGVRSVLISGGLDCGPGTARRYSNTSRAKGSITACGIFTAPYQIGSAGNQKQFGQRYEYTTASRCRRFIRKKGATKPTDSVIGSFYYTELFGQRGQDPTHLDASLSRDLGQIFISIIF